MLTEVKAGARIFCTCDMCKREIIYAIPSIEVDRLEEFGESVLDTMNAEGWAIGYHSVLGWSWICPECNK